MNPRQRSSARGRARWSPLNYQRNSTAGRRPKPISIQIPHSNSDDDQAGSSESQPIAVRHIGSNNEQYPGWNLYFPEETYAEDSKIVGKLKAFEKHITSNPTQYDLQATRKRLWYQLTLSTVTSDATFMSSWSSFQHDLVESPEETLQCIGLAMYQLLIKLPSVPCPTQSDLSSNRDINLRQVNARIQTNLKPVALNSVKVDRNGKLIIVRENVVRVSSLDYRATWMAYRCMQCHAVQAIKQTTQSETLPRSCPCKNRSSRNFSAIVSSPFSTMQACQTIHLQETLTTNQSGRVPRTIKIELFQDLVDSVYPGDDVTVTAIVQCPPQEKRGVAPLRDIYLKAVSLSSNRNAAITWKSTFSEKDIGAIQAIKSKPCPFRLLVHSLAPTIYGHEMIKAGLVLALLSGSDNPNRRSQCHVLIVGDPGLGKSQMLQACAESSPKGGHYNKSKTVSENVKMNPALLSRFDLVFIILDRPNAELDSVLHDYRRNLSNIPQVLASSSSLNATQSSLNSRITEPLDIRLKLQRNEKIDHLPLILMQTYIAYARKNCHPKLSEGAINLLRDFFLELRTVRQGGNSIPVTTRQLESMIRLVQARARAELCDEASIQHANDVITIIRYSMVDVLSTEVGTIQLQRNVNGSGVSQTGQIRQFVRLLQAKSAQLGKTLFSISELKEIAANGNLQFLSFADTIETMNIQGFLLKKGQSLYKFLND